MSNKALYEELTTDEKVSVTSIGSQKNGCYIIMGKDKNIKTEDTGNTLVPNESSSTSYEAGSIDLFVGLNKLNRSKLEVAASESESTGRLEQKYLNSDFSKDSARIYISEKANPDEYFSLPKSPLSPSDIGKSSVVMLADSTRIVGRNSLKLITGKYGSLNSDNQKNANVKGIHLIAGSDPSGLEPMVKGDKLVEYLKKQNRSLLSIIDKVLGFVNADITELWNYVSKHTHLSTAPGGPVGLPMDLTQIPLDNYATMRSASLASEINNTLKEIKVIIAKEQNYLERGKQSILSNYNLTN